MLSPAEIKAAREFLQAPPYYKLKVGFFMRTVLKRFMSDIQKEGGFINYYSSDGWFSSNYIMKTDINNKGSLDRILVFARLWNGIFHPGKIDEYVTFVEGT